MSGGHIIDISGSYPLAAGDARGVVPHLLPDRVVTPRARLSNLCKLTEREWRLSILGGLHLQTLNHPGSNNTKGCGAVAEITFNHSQQVSREAAE